MLYLIREFGMKSGLNLLQYSLEEAFTRMVGTYLLFQLRNTFFLLISNLRI